VLGGRAEQIEVPDKPWQPAALKLTLSGAERRSGAVAEHATRPARTLSPGERTRAELAVVAHRRATCLLLDEPTNHLDLESLEVLEAALAGWPGALVVATHDLRLRDALALTREVVLEGR
jgi:ATPase subunit of ABC transporter with duplicated ATPase domains